MHPPIRFASRSASRQGATRILALCALILLPFGLLATGILATGCTPSDSQQVVTAAGYVPPPSAAVSGTIRTRVAAVVKKEVAAHPKIAPWANELAKVCFQSSGLKLPDPGTLQTGFTVAGYFVPADYATAFSSLSAEVEKLYSADFPAASAVQSKGTPYLTLFGQGIQDGITAAGVTEAP